MSTLYVFLDESGDFQFFPTSTKYFTLTSLISDDISQLSSAFDSLKYRIIESAPDFREFEYFHANNDPPPIRFQVYELLSGLENYKVDSVTVAKNVIFPHLRPVWRFYPHMLELLIKWAFRDIELSEYERIIFIMDYLKLRSRREAFIKAVKENVKPLLENNQRLDAWLHSSSSHYPLQAVDYFGWAIFRKREIGDSKYKDIVKSKISSDFRFYQRVRTKFY